SGVEQLKAVNGGKMSRKTALIAGIALFTTVALSAGIFFKFAPISKFSDSFYQNEYGVTPFHSHDEVKKELERLNSSKLFSFSAGDNAIEYRSAEEYAPDAANGSAPGSSETGSASGSSGGSSDNYNSTYTQVEGVDEADIVKTDGKYIYSASGSMINVFPADPENLSRAAVINSPDDYIEEFFITGNQLIAISSDYNYEGYYSYNSVTDLYIYDISDIGNIYLKDSFRQTGSYLSSRLIDNKLYLVSSSYAYDNSFIPGCRAAQSTADEPDLAPIPAEGIYMMENASEASFTTISSIDISKSAQPSAIKSILGPADEFYCNTEHLYLTSRERNSDPLREFAMEIINNLDYLDGYYDETSVAKTRIVKIDLNSALDFLGSAEVEGTIKDRYSLDEYGGNLRIATTSYNARTENTNNLYVLDAEMKPIGSVIGFAENESIKAVHYVNDTAYVITYRQTDPLFIIDLSDPTSPQITGEAKISGFSTMLVPVDENTLLGIGYHTNTFDYDFNDMEYQDGLKLVVFDISDKSNPVVSDTKVFEEAYSSVQNDPRALLYNPERNDYTIPFYQYGEANRELYDGG
ncbi:MAG: beta-propeller domain-containing protein, partial [Ruminococcus sp.]|nr:beta-propeller domain-containing protein [Ruminococcus sp.]